LLAEIQQHVRHNFVVNVLDGTFFGFALGLASYVTILPLFVSTMTDSTLLIGMVASIQPIGWQLPQLLVALRVARLRRYKRMVLLASLHERWPYFGLALVAWLLPTVGPQIALLLTFALLIWQALGGGFTATPWQSMTGKIMPTNRRGTFWGVQAFAANLMSSAGAVIAGALLASLPSPLDFTLCFLIAGAAMLISFAFLALTREPESEKVDTLSSSRMALSSMIAILRVDVGFRWFILARILAQIAWTAIAFYTIYAVRAFNMDEQIAGVLAGVMTLAHMGASPLLGWFGDHWGHRMLLMVSGLAIAASALLAILAPDISWFYVVFGLAGFFNAVLWTTIMAMTVEFGSERERPLYIGLSNTIVGPVTIFAPLIGGWLADTISFNATFLMSVMGGVLMILAVQRVAPRRKSSASQLSPSPVPAPLDQ
jgi:MFS family permease